MHSPKDTNVSSLIVISLASGNREAADEQYFDSSAASSPGVNGPSKQPPRKSALKLDKNVNDWCLILKICP